MSSPYETLPASTCDYRIFKQAAAYNGGKPMERVLGVEVLIPSDSNENTNSIANADINSVSLNSFLLNLLQNSLAFQTGLHSLLILFAQVHDWCKDKDSNVPLSASKNFSFNVYLSDM